MKHKFSPVLVAVIFISFNVFAQSVIKKQMRMGGKSDDNFGSMYATKDNGFIIGGSSKSNRSNEKSQNNRDALGYTNDYWILKLDSTLNIQWDKTLGGKQEDDLASIQQTSDGGYIAGGSSWSKHYKEKSDNSQWDDYWIIKMDSIGNINWDKTIGGDNQDGLSAVRQTKDGGYILGGSSMSNKSGEKSENIRGNYDYWVVKINDTGKVEWDKTIGGNNWDNLTALQPTKDGGYILGGWSRSNKSGEKTENNRDTSMNETEDYWIVKLNAGGNIQWDKTIGGDKGDVLTSLQQTDDGGYILGGRSSSGISGEKTQSYTGSFENFDYWIVKLDSTGKIQWDKTIGGQYDDRLTSIIQTKDRGYIIAGYSNSGVSGQKTEGNRGYDDYWVIKVTKNGTYQWDKTIGGSVEDFCYSITEIARNHYAVGGTSNSGISGDKIQNSRGGTDYWVVKLVYKAPVNLEMDSAAIAGGVTMRSVRPSMYVYPNPANNLIHVHCSGKSVFTLSNQLGEVLFSKTITGYSTLNVSDLKPGLYFLKNVMTGGVNKLLIER